MQYLVVLLAACLASPTLGQYGGHYGGASHGGYSGPLASPVVTPNGFLADTPEVAAAKAAHFSEVSKVQTAPGYSAGGNDGSYNPSYNAPAPASYAAPAASYGAPASYAAPAPSYGGAPAYASGSRYNGPLAKLVVTPNGFLADTPEVAAAKAAHFSEVSKVQSAPGYTAGGDDGSYRPAAYASAPAAYNGAPAAYASAPASYGNQGYYGAPAAPTGGYTGPLAKPVVTPNGFLADTPEVAAAKAAHFSEVARNQAPQGHRYRRSLVVAAPHVAPVAYAAPVVAYSTLAVHRPALAYSLHRY